MRMVIVETVGKGTRTVLIGREPKKKYRKKKERLLILSFIGIVCSPRILPRTGSDNKPTDIRCWKTTKNGESHAKKGWQRHTDRKPSRRRARRGHHRPWISPSARILNELGRCIYPCVDWIDYLEYTMERR